jgi:hypothetical protein
MLRPDARPVDGDGSVVAARRFEQAPAQVLPRKNVLAIDRDDFIGSGQARDGRRRAGRRRGQNGAFAGNPGDVGAREKQHRQKQIGGRPGRDDRDSSPHRLAIECASQVRGETSPSRSSTILT